MSIDLKFNDKLLAEAVKASAVELDEFQKRLDEATADTKALEKYLQSTGFCIDTYVSVDTNTFHEIGWDKSGDSWRLVGRYWDDNDLIVRPLAESSARLRLACRPYLAKLVEEITETLTSTKEPVADHFE